MKNKLLKLNEFPELKKIFKKDGISMPFNEDINICDIIYKGYKEYDYNHLEVVDASEESLNVLAIYSSFKEYEFITYCFNYEKEGEIFIGIVPEIQEYFYIKPTFISKLLKIDNKECQGKNIYISFKENLKKIIL